MRIVLSLSLALITTAVAQQTPAPQETKTFISAQEVTDLIAKAKNQRKENQARVTQRLLHLGPQTANLEYRAALDGANSHPGLIELYYVVEGSGTMVIGGKLVNEKKVNATHIAGTAIEGGTSRKVAKGDFILVPENAAHWVSAMDGTLALMSMTMPATGGEADEPLVQNQETKTFISAQEVTDLIAKAKNQRKENQARVTQRLLHLGPQTANLEYRAALDGANSHPGLIELYYVVEGSGTMVIGGKLVNEKKVNATHIAGTAIEGGTSRKVAKGDFILVPENAAHWVSAMDGTLALMSMTMPVER